MKFFLFRHLLVVTNALSLSIVHRLARAVGYLAWLLNGESRQIVEANIRLCFPELDATQRSRLVRETLSESGKAILEAGKMWHGEVDDVLALLQPSADEHLIDRAMRQKRGVILAIPHCGCWEIAGLYFARHYAMTSMYAARGRPQFDELIKNARQRSGATLVPAGASGIRAMHRALKRQELVALMPDQSPLGNGEFADFFGQPCYTMTLLPRLAKRTDATVLFVFAKRLPHSRGFQIVIRQPERDIAKLSLPDALQTMNDAIESLIREAPEQYWWTYKRFKKRPEDLPPLY